MGIELQARWRPIDWFNISGNISLSENKVMDFVEYFDDYDNGGQKTKSYDKTDISFSPALTGGATLNFRPAKYVELSILSKYVGIQYLDNTSNKTRALEPFYTQDAIALFTVSDKLVRELNLVLQVNNIFNAKYEPNGYTFSYIYGGETITENFYYPMAGTNFMIGLNLKF
jgi:iron complex outermembrane receptor protein